MSEGEYAGRITLAPVAVYPGQQRPVASPDKPA